MGALLVGLSTGKGAGRRARTAVRAGRSPAGPRRGELPGPHGGRRSGDSEPGGAFEPPFLCLIASGGHTLLVAVSEHDGYEVLGRTLDDAAGEAFDKGARMLGLGYPGGAALERLAAGGDPEAFAFPGSRAERARGGRGQGREAFAQGLDFSFAGLKTALLYKLRELGEAEAQARARRPRGLLPGGDRRQPDPARRERAGADRARRLAVGGGVAANGELRRRLGELGAELHVPPRVLCTDNAAMIASAARFTRRAALPGLPRPRRLRHRRAARQLRTRAS